MSSADKKHILHGKPKKNKNTAEETGGYNGPNPTSYGDWQHKGKVTDF